MNDQYQEHFFDLVNILSLYVGLENMQENRFQSAQNDVQSANDRQAKYLLQEVNRRFDEQNRILAEQNKMLEKLLEVMEGEAHHAQ